MLSIDLNCDLGESFGAYTVGMDAEILPYVTSANIACGFHAGDPSVMQKSVLLCKKYGVQVGAHPGLPDLQGFGRRRMAISPAEAEADVMYQIGALKAFCDAAGVPLHHVKPHGALYNMAARDPVLAAAICRAVQAAAPGAVLLALSGSEMVKAANAIGLPVASEVFADRGYRADGSLVPRGAPGAMIEDEDTAIARVLQMAAQGTVQADDGSTVTLQADSVCVHGDGPKSPSCKKSPPPSLPQGQQLQYFDCRQKARWGMNLSEEGKAALSGRICPAPLPGCRNFLSIKIPLYRVIQRLNNLNATLMCLGSESCTEDEPTP